MTGLKVWNSVIGQEITDAQNLTKICASGPAPFFFRHYKRRVSGLGDRGSMQFYH